MSNVQESYPSATSGVGIPAFLELSGSGVSNANPETPSGALVGGNNTYKVTLSLSSAGGHSNTVAITGSLFDLAASAQATSPKTFTAVSYNALPTSSSGTQESYPVPNATVGQVATVGAVTNNANGTASFTITAQHLGQAVVELQYPAFGNGETNYVGAGSGSPSLPLQNDNIYSQILVQVIP